MRIAVLSILQLFGCRRKKSTNFSEVPFHPNDPAIVKFAKSESHCQKRARIALSDSKNLGCYQQKGAIIVRKEDDIEGFCRIKTLWEGIASDLNLMKLEIPNKKCKDTQIAPNMDGPDVLWDLQGQRDSKAFYSTIAKILRVFEYMHALRLVSGPSFLNVIGDSVIILDPKRSDESVFWSPKSDLISLVDRFAQIQALVDKSNRFALYELLDARGLFCSFASAVMNSDDDARGEFFDYTGWITRFEEGISGENDAQSRPPSPQWWMENDGFSAKWWDGFNACIRKVPNNYCEGVPNQCGIGHTYTLESIGTLTVLKRMGTDAGSTAYVYTTSEGEILHKLVFDPQRCTESLYAACTERVSLDLLNGLEGNVPMGFVPERIDGKCTELSVFMNRISGIPMAQWLETIHNPSDGRILTVVANHVLVLEKLHKAGLVHNDNHVGNVMVDPKTFDVKLIDFGFARPAVKDGKPIVWGHVISPLWTDVVRAFQPVKERFAKKKLVNLEKAWQLLNKVSLFGKPDYEGIANYLNQAVTEL
jgi:hypothetical protein